MNFNIDALSAKEEETLIFYAKWAKNHGIWDGRPISLEDTSKFKEIALQRITALQSENQNFDLPKIPEAPVTKDTHPLSFFQNMEASIGKSMGKFWKKHKVEILVGVAVVAVITAIVVVTIASGGAAGAAAAGAAGGAAGGAALGDDSKKSKTPSANKPSQNSSASQTTNPKGADKDFSSQSITKKELDSVPYTPPPVYKDPETGSYHIETSPTFNSHPVPPPILPSTSQELNHNPSNGFQEKPGSFQQTMPHNELPPVPNFHQMEQYNAPNPHPIAASEPKVSESREPQNLQQSSQLNSDLETILPPDIPPESKGWFRVLAEKMGRDIIDSPELFEEVPSLQFTESETFSTGGRKNPSMAIMTINGINTSQSRAMEYAQSLSEKANGYAVDWVYNKTHSIPTDAAEVLFLNLSWALSPASERLIEKWTEFHNANIDNPNAKILQFCYSQGVIHTRNALRALPPEIRDRIMVTAFGPPVIIPDDFCYRVYHYACKGDLIPFLEEKVVRVSNRLGSVEDRGALYDLEEMRVLEIRKIREEKLVWLDRHPETVDAHDFMNPVFEEFKNDAISEYLKKKGEYL